jgi:protoporphyrinogen oxidase
MTNSPSAHHVAIIGAGFTGLTAAFELTRRGFRVTVLEAENEPGGMASCFRVNGNILEKFYHHLFLSDRHIVALIRELGIENTVLRRRTKSGIYIRNNVYELCTPKDLLRFSPLSFTDRLKLGSLTLRAGRIQNWQSLEKMTAKEWLIRLGGKSAYEVVWAPLLRGKFGPFAEDIGAVWMWNKLKLRGGSRDKNGAENLIYIKGGFVTVIKALESAIKQQGGRLLYKQAATGVQVERNKIVGITTHKERFNADAVLSTLPLPVAAELIGQSSAPQYLATLNRIKYLANICLVLQLNRPLSDIYWLNVTDPGFPFVGIIEHTNFEPPSSYGGRHIVYLSKYLPETDPLFVMADEDILSFTLPFLQKMFPEFQPSNILGQNIWRARYTQPIVEKHYSGLIPSRKTPIHGFYLSSMAQIYPEDRGINYAVREGRRVAEMIQRDLQSERHTMQ